MTASRLSFRTAVIFAIIGVAMGIAMAASHKHSVIPAHAHINLLGWVSLFLMGIYYKLHPARDASRAALAQVAIWILGTAGLGLGLTALNLGHASAEPIAVVASLVILADLVAFAVLVFRTRADDARHTAQLAPAE